MSSKFHSNPIFRQGIFFWSHRVLLAALLFSIFLSGNSVAVIASMSVIVSCMTIAMCIFVYDMVLLLASSKEGNKDG